jgi:hypothetical protein
MRRSNRSSRAWSATFCKPRASAIVVLDSHSQLPTPSERECEAQDECGTTSYLQTVSTQMPPQSAPPRQGLQSSRGSSTHVNPAGHCLPVNPPHAMSCGGHGVQVMPQRPAMQVASGHEKAAPSPLVPGHCRHATAGCGHMLASTQARTEKSALELSAAPCSEPADSPPAHADTRSAIRIVALAAHPFLILDIVISNAPFHRRGSAIRSASLAPSDSGCFSGRGPTQRPSANLKIAR